MTTRTTYKAVMRGSKSRLNRVRLRGRRCRHAGRRTATTSRVRIQGQGHACLASAVCFEEIKVHHNR
jgi:hypothetical protein